VNILHYNRVADNLSVALWFCWCFWEHPL